jgi:hypothetical protein
MLNHKYINSGEKQENKKMKWVLHVKEIKGNKKYGRWW